MEKENQEHLSAQTKARHKRIRLAKKLLRPMPRKTNLHRYPILKYFSKTLKDRTYLWEFRRKNVVVGIWIGWLIVLIPIYSLQMLICLLLSIPLKGNALVSMALQWVSNPITLIPLLYIQYIIGHFFYRLLGGIPPNINIMEALKNEKILETLKAQTDFDAIIYIAATVFGGGIILSVICATINTLLYIGLANLSKNKTLKKDGIQ